MPQNCSLEGKKKKASLHKLPLPISQGLPHQMFILWHSSVSMCECYPVPTSIPYCNVKELEHKTAGMLQAKVKCSHITYLYEAGCYVMARLKRGPWKTRDKAQKLSNTVVHVSRRLLFCSESALQRYEIPKAEYSYLCIEIFP